MRRFPNNNTSSRRRQSTAFHPWLGFTAASLTSDLSETVEGLEPNFKGV